MQRLTTRPGLVSLKVKPNWFASKWLAGICIAWFLLVSGATAQTTEEPSPEPKVAATQPTDAQAASQSQSASDIQSLRERLQRQEDVVLEMRHANVDWWLAGLSALVALLGLGGILFPYLMGYTHRASLKSELEEARRMVASIEKHEQKAAHVSEQMQNYSSGTEQDPNVQASLQEEAKSLQENPQASESDKLRARAVLASQEGYQSIEQALQAYDLWQALTVLQPRDAFAQSNAGYWAQQLFNKKADPTPSYWLQKLKQHYGIALEIKPDYHEALNNWGAALDDEAKALAGQNLPAARRLWQEAGGKFSEALKIKPDDHEVLYNWGNASSAEARVLAGQDLVKARELWQEAGNKYSEALKIKPDFHEALYNWGNASSAEARVLAGQDLVKARELWQEAGSKYSEALKIKPDFHEALYNWGNALDDEAIALAGQNLPAARRLWQEAGVKFSEALKIKPDLHEALYNWGNALANEAWELKEQQPENKAEIEGLLLRAQEMLERPSLSGDTQGQVKCAYVLASIYAMQGKATECVEQLKIAQKAKILPSKADLEKDRDLDDVRDSEVFQKWWSSL